MSESSFSDAEELSTSKEKHKSTLSLPGKKTQSGFLEDDLPKPRQQFHGTLITPIKNNNGHTKRHSRTNSTSFEEYNYGNNGYKNLHHRRGHSWSDTTTTAPRRRSHDSSALLVGIHNQFGPPINNNGETPPHGKTYVKIKTKIKTNKKFNRIVLAQTLAVDTTEVYATSGLPVIKVEDNEADNKHPNGAIWANRFSKDGKYMATGGQNCVVNVWKVLRDLDRNDNIEIQDINPHEPSIKVFHDVPVQTYTGHTADILDISWSKNNFIVSSSMDKTVRLWHISQKVCLCVFRHLDVVTSVKFHPKDDRFFLSGSLDCKVRLWSIPEKRVAFWNEIPSVNMVTAVGFTLDGRTACVGANTGDVFFFETQGLKYNTQILVKNYRNKRGKKVTGIEPMPGMPLGEERILVTTNDSRIWIINMKDKSCVHKYKGLDNPVMQIKASFSDDGRYIISGSEDGCIYLWCTDQVNYSPFQHLHDSRLKAAATLGHLGDHVLQTVIQYNDNVSELAFGGVSGWLKKGERRVIDKLRSRNEHFTAHQHAVTSAIFAPTKTRQQLAKAKGDIIFENTPVYTHKEVDNDRDSAYEDAISHRRRSMTSSIHHCNHKDTNEIPHTLMDEFEEATPEERDLFDYPDSQIIVSADLHGAIKVWRMDSGVYDDEEYETLDVPHHQKRSAVAPAMASTPEVSTPSSSFFKSALPKKKSAFSHLFSKFSKS